MRAFKTRFITSIIMISGFLLIITMGHVYCAVLIMNLVFFMYKELISLKRKDEKDRKSLFNWIDWYYFASFAFLQIPHLFLRRVLVENAIPTGSFLHLILYDYHKIISFGLFTFGILFFVWSLEKGSYRYQFQRFAWSMLALVFVFLIPTFILYNLYKGIYWFVFPQLCVIVNDIFAYLFGITFGKTPLIKLSPKKTWEGFIGGMFSTFIFAFAVSFNNR
jgi:phosphatidate cytidylyltransferase